MTIETISGVVGWQPEVNKFGFGSIKIDGTYYGTGKAVAPGINKGDFVTFKAEQNAKGYWDVKGPIRKGEGTATATSAAAGPVASAYAGKEDSKQKSISWQAARNSAVEFMKLLHERDALPKPAATAKKGDAFSVLSTMLNEITTRFYDESQHPKSGASGASDGDAAKPVRAARPAVDTSEAEGGDDDAGWDA